MDYGNATFLGVPACRPFRLASVLNVAARSVTGIRRDARPHRQHPTVNWRRRRHTLINFHWLGVPERINFKLAILVYLSLVARHVSLHTCRTIYIASLRFQVHGRACGLL